MAGWKILATLALCVMLFGAAGESQGGPPVRVDGCSLGVRSMRQTNAALIAARFTNMGETSSDWIDFLVWWGDGTVDTVHDVGRFVPRVEIKHTWNVSIGIRQVRPRLWDYVVASVARVHYADGSEWTSPYIDLPDEQEYARMSPRSTRCLVSPV